jgi:hypothetical protein
MMNKNPKVNRKIEVIPSYAPPDKEYNPKTGMIGERALIIHRGRELPLTEEVEQRYFLGVKGGRC